MCSQPQPWDSRHKHLTSLHGFTKTSARTALCKGPLLFSFRAQNPTRLRTHSPPAFHDHLSHRKHLEELSLDRGRSICLQPRLHEKPSDLLSALALVLIFSFSLALSFL